MVKNEHIKVVIAGFPNPLAAQVATACQKRGMNVANFGLASNECKEGSIDVPEVGKLQLFTFADNKAKEQLAAESEQARKEKRHLVVADVSNNPQNVELYNNCKVPFVMQSSDHKGGLEAGEKSKQLAVIADDFNKYAVAFDSIMQEWGQRFPGLFRGFDLIDEQLFPSNRLMQSFNDLFDTKWDRDYQQKAGGNTAYIEGHAQQEFTFKNGSGSTSFTFTRSAKPEEYADGMADAVGFLAQQAEASTTPRVYSMLDVARRAPLMIPWTV